MLMRARPFPGERGARGAVGRCRLLGTASEPCTPEAVDAGGQHRVLGLRAGFQSGRGRAATAGGARGGPGAVPRKWRRPRCAGRCGRLGRSAPPAAPSSNPATSGRRGGGHGPRGAPGEALENNWGVGGR
ncbi:hypothetical protein LUU34_00441500 [Aix galericulata]|nr:hypothetical protein LUU34_00441500 [Aix galericulata]